MKLVKYFGLALCLYSFPLLAANYDITGVAMGSHRKLEMSQVKIQSSIVPSVYTFAGINTEAVIHIEGIVSGENYCPADQIVVLTNAKTQGSHPNSITEHTIALFEIRLRDQNGLDLDGNYCIEGTGGSFSLDLVARIRGLSADETVKRWNYIIPTRQGTRTVQVTYEIKPKKWNVVISK